MASSTLAPSLALIGAEAHFIVSRVHGDCRGGKAAPTNFALMLHVAGAWSGASPELVLSLHRILIAWTYFLTGLRKLYCCGPKWCDGKNLQLMLAIQASPMLALSPSRTVTLRSSQSALRPVTSTATPRPDPTRASTTT